MGRGRTSPRPRCATPRNWTVLRLEKLTRTAHVDIAAGHIGRWHERMAPLTLLHETPQTARPPRRPPGPPKSEASPIEGRLGQTVIESLEDAKAEDIVSIDLTGKTTIADLMIIATGRSNVHVGAIADRVSRACRAAGFPAPRIEGVPHCDWVLLDAGDAIIHIFKPDVRQFYNLEKMWSADRPGDARPARSS
jgi:ribosome-associated protein